MICQVCGFASGLIFDACPVCEGQGTDEQPSVSQAVPIEMPIPQGRVGAKGEPEPACVLTHTVFDRLGHDGLPLGGVILLAGAPGLGKSAQCRLLCARWPATAVYCSYEERLSLVRTRIGAWTPGLYGTHGEVYVDAPPFDAECLDAVWADRVPLLVIVDSLQTADVGESYPIGNIAHVLEVQRQATALAHRHPAATVVLIGHVTRAETIAGPRAIEHLVDTTITMKRNHVGERVWHVSKNRLGAVGEWLAPLGNGIASASS
jgi:DNA repair protein RadA/Sms